MMPTQPRSATPRPDADSCCSPRIFVAEDAPELRALLTRMLRRSGYCVEEIADGETLLRAVQRARLRGELPDLIVSDGVMPGRSGLDVLRRLRACGIHTPFVLITAFGDVSLHLEVSRFGASYVLDKPVDLEELRVAARLLVSTPAANDTNHEQ